MAYVKLDCGMLDSTTWFDKDGRDIFITALLMAIPRQFDDPQDQLEVNSLEHAGWTVPPGWYGFVDAASLGIIARCGIQTSKGIEALERLGSPEVESRSQDFGGRRLVRVDGGFLILNYIRYREKDHTAAERQRRYRERQKERNAVTSRNITQAEAEAKAEAEEKKPEGLNLVAWNDYVAHRKELRAKRLTLRGRQMAMKKLASLSEDKQRTVVDASIANGWIGLFPEKVNEKTKPGDSFDTKLRNLRERAGIEQAG